MIRISTLFIFAVFLISIVTAEVVLPSWDWSQYTGSTQWRTTVTEDGCGAGGITTTKSVTVDFNKGHAQIGDWGHGMFSGLIQGNTLHIPGKTIPDGGGSSKIYPFDVIFTSDCLTFTATYDWDYSDEYISCSGSTTLDGRIVNGCPAPTEVPVVPDDNPTVITPSIETLRQEISDVRVDLNLDLAFYSGIEALQESINFYKRKAMEDDDPHEFDSLIAPLYQDIESKKAEIKKLEPSIEARYKTILDKDPYNFWANWDMAELKKAQGKYDEFSTYFDAAATNKNQFEGTKNTQLEQNVAHDLGLSQIPSVKNSEVVRIIRDEDGRWTGGRIYNLNVPKEAAGDKSWSKKLFTTFSKKAYGLIRDVAGLPGDK